jgi:peptide/nickel transport system substrate-binding protein
MFHQLQHRSARDHSAKWARSTRNGALVGVAVALITATCGQSSATAATTTTAPPGHTLTIPLLSDLAQGGLDPDVYYADEGVNIIDAAYDTLLQYEPNTAKPTLEPDLATSWSISPNALTYTFHLRAGVKFHDGTAFTSAAVRADFARRAAVNGAPAYMVADIASVATPSPLVAVVHLKTPNNAFLDELASEYGPRMISPTALATHAAKDHDEAWLTTHEDGTGAYTVTDEDGGQLYVLRYFPQAWEPKPYYTTIDFKVTPSITTQELELEAGSLDLIEHSLPSAAVKSLGSSGKLKVYEFPTTEQELVSLNPHNGALSSLAVRAAILETIDKQAIVNTVWPGQASVATQIFPLDEVPHDTALQDPKYDPDALTKLKSKLNGQDIVIDFQAGEAVEEQVADLLQAEFAGAGMKSEAIGISQAQITDIEGTDPTTPSMVITEGWPDGDQPYMQAHIAFDPGGGEHYFTCPSGGTSVLQQAVRATNPKTALQLYEKAGNLYSQTDCWDLLANNHDTMVAPSWLGGLTHDVAAPYVLLLRYLHPVQQ